MAWGKSEARIPGPGGARIVGAYADFQEWHCEQQLAAGFDVDDIKDYPTAEMLAAMRKWVRLGKPI